MALGAKARRGVNVVAWIPPVGVTVISINARIEKRRSRRGREQSWRRWPHRRWIIAKVSAERADKGIDDLRLDRR